MLEYLPVRGALFRALPRNKEDMELNQDADDDDQVVVGALCWTDWNDGNLWPGFCVVPHTPPGTLLHFHEYSSPTPYRTTTGDYIDILVVGSFSGFKVLSPTCGANLLESCFSCTRFCTDSLSFITRGGSATFQIFLEKHRELNFND